MENSPPQAILFFVVLTIWVITWKGLALWFAAKYNQKRWFIGLTAALFPILFFNTLGFLDIIYLFFFAKKRLTFTDIRQLAQRAFGKKN